MRPAITCCLALLLLAGCAPSPHAAPSLATTLYEQPGWSRADPTTVLHRGTGCLVEVRDLPALAYVPGSVDDDQASALALAALGGGGGDDLATAEGVWMLGGVVPGAMGGDAYAAVRAFSDAGVDLVVTLTCLGGGVDRTLFTEQVLPFIEVRVGDQPFTPGR